MSRSRAVKILLVACAIGSGALTPSTASATARIVVLNVDGPDEGFNDPTPAAPVGGNPATTKGQQRLIAFQHAANLWGLMLDSNVEIRVRAQFSPLGPGVLGSAGPTSVFSDFPGEKGFPGSEFPETWYASALADKRAGIDLAEALGSPGVPDISANFSSDFDFYLGLDNQHGAQIDLVTVVLHEIGHGLGFLTFVNPSTGANFSGQTDVFARLTLDTTNNTVWSTMATAAERAASARRADKIVFNGDQATGAAPFVLQFGRPEINVYAPASIAGSARVGLAAFGPPLNSPGITGNVVVALDAVVPVTSPSPTDGCSPLTNAAAVAGKIALVDRGACVFTVKAKNAQDAGAIAVIVADNAPGDPPPGLGGVDATIVIPAVRISQALGAAIKARLAAPEIVTVNIGVDITQRAGADPTGFPQLYATDPVQPGSSISHYDNIAFKNLLMEPAINADLTHELIPPFDVTLPLMRDLGWFVDGDLDGTEDRKFTFGRCTTREPDVQLPNGAMLSDQARVWYRDCAMGTRGRSKFENCVGHTTNDAVKAGLITRAERKAVRKCAERHDDDDDHDDRKGSSAF